MCHFLQRFEGGMPGKAGNARLGELDGVRILRYRHPMLTHIELAAVQLRRHPIDGEFDPFARVLAVLIRPSTSQALQPCRFDKPGSRYRQSHR
jgi:hypothetical protein